MVRQLEIKNKTDYYVTVITTPYLQELPVIQLGNKIIHRLFRKAKFIFCSKEGVNAMYSAICFKSEFTQYLSKVHFSNILLPTKSIPTLFQKKNHWGSRGTLNSFTLRRIFF